MDENTQVELIGLAAAIGRLSFALKQTEAALASAQARVAELEAERERDDAG